MITEIMSDPACDEALIEEKTSPSSALMYRWRTFNADHFHLRAGEERSEHPVIGAGTMTARPAEHRNGHQEEGGTMRTSHRILLRLYHDPAFDFSRVTVWYIDRGAPKDRSRLGGEQIRLLDRDYIETESAGRMTAIPYHRILTILYDGRVVWDREHGDLLV
jgi:uncharacterized protein (UPF0248 family)